MRSPFKRAIRIGLRRVPFKGSSQKLPRILAVARNIWGFRALQVRGRRPKEVEDLVGFRAVVFRVFGGFLGLGLVRFEPFGFPGQGSENLGFGNVAKGASTVKNACNTRIASKIYACAPLPSADQISPRESVVVTTSRTHSQPRKPEQKPQLQLLRNPKLCQGTSNSETPNPQLCPETPNPALLSTFFAAAPARLRHSNVAVTATAAEALGAFVLSFLRCCPGRLGLGCMASQDRGILDKGSGL